MSKSATVRTRDPERTRQKLLDAAMTEFATHGLTGAKVERIARRAGVNKRLVYHYFKSKERLYREVLERAYLLIHTREDEINLDTRRPEEALADLIDRTFERIIALPHVNALIVDQNLHRAKHIKNAAWVQDMHGRLIEQIQAMLDAGCKAGVFRPNVDPVRLFISVLALCLTYVTNR
jgi:AcrR family transcriptional regulator